jgi:hypothetical protein
VIAAGSAGLFIVLHQEPAAEWGRGEPRQIVRGFPSVLERDVQVALLVLEADRRSAAIVDLEGEGRPVVLFEGGVIFATGAELGVIEPVPVPSFICPC